MQCDLRSHPKYAEILGYLERIHGPALGTVSLPVDASVSANGVIAFDGHVYEQLSGVPTSRIGLWSQAQGARDITHGPNADRLPRFSPDGRSIAFLSDRERAGRMQPFVMNADGTGVTALADVPGTVESLAWSSDGMRVMFQAVGEGADVAGALGSGTGASAPADAPWIPHVEESVPAELWRRLYVLDYGARSLRELTLGLLTVWEFEWCGPQHAIAIVSADPREGSWYRAHLVRIDVTTGDVQTLHVPADQLGVPAGSPGGNYAACIEAVCSDRLVVAGDLVLCNLADGSVRRLSAHGVDVTHLVWRDDARLLAVGIRRFDVVAVEYDARTGELTEIWSTSESCGRRYPICWPFRDGFVAFVDSYERYPCLVAIENGKETVLHDFAHAGSEFQRSVAGTLERVSWHAGDGLEIHGYLARPQGPAPYPLVVNVHGGPVWSFRNTWSMWYFFTSVFVAHGYAVFHPNPRGSSGRGQDFAKAVRGDMVGQDTHDIIAGVETLVARGIADPARLMVTGQSYGGYMSSWIVNKTDIFAASVPIAPVTDALSQHFTSNIPDFDAIFLGASPFDKPSRFLERSPVIFAGQVTTPTLSITGGRDRCTPPTQALEFHRALVESGVPSELVTYPQEGHGIRALEAQADACVRMLTWFEKHRR